MIAEEGGAFMCGHPGTAEFATVWSEGPSTFGARDPLGVVPLYYAKKGKRWIFATSLREITSAFGPVTPNRKYLQALWWDFFGLHGETAFKEILRVPPGHLLEIHDGRARLKRYFEMQSSEATLDIRSAVEEATAKRGIGYGKVGLFLSGGFDSSMIAHIFNKSRPENCELSSYTLTFPKDTSGHSAELPDVLEGAKWRAITCPFDASDPVFLDSDKSLYFYSPNLNIYKGLLRLAKRDGIRLVMTGLGGDDIFSHSQNILASLMLEGMWLPYVKHLLSRPDSVTFASALRGSFAPLIPNWAYKIAQKFIARRPGGFNLTPLEEKNLLTVIYRFEQERRRLDRLPHLSNIRAKFFLSGMGAFAFEQEQELAQEFGCLMSYPLLDVKLISAALCAPTQAHFENYWDKGLLRTAMAPILPDSIQKIHSRQNYNDLVDEVMRKQKTTFDARRQWLKAKAVLDQCTAQNLSLDETRFVNYAYKIFNHCNGARYEQKSVRQKAVSEANLETLWLG